MQHVKDLTNLIEPIERATLAAVSPQAVHELPAWLLPFDTGTVGRAKSAVPLRHSSDNAQLTMVDTIEQHYRARGIQASFRLPDVASFDVLRSALRLKGYRPEQPTLVQVAKVAAMRAVTAQAAAEVASAPDAGWASVFLGEGFDPLDGASRVQSLSKASGTVFASVREAGHTIAAGAGAFSHGWASVHGMRTAAAQRGKGLAARVLAGIADAALHKGLDDVFLQVQEDNTSALILYQRAGFNTVWKYVYWRLPPAKGCSADRC
jgi:N-acetylglutamate synthase